MKFLLLFEVWGGPNWWTAEQRIAFEDCFTGEDYTT